MTSLSRTVSDLSSGNENDDAFRKRRHRAHDVFYHDNRDPVGVRWRYRSLPSTARRSGFGTPCERRGRCHARALPGMGRDRRGQLSRRRSPRLRLACCQSDTCATALRVPGPVSASRPAINLKVDAIACGCVSRPTSPDDTRPALRGRAFVPPSQFESVRVSGFSNQYSTVPFGRA